MRGGADDTDTNANPTQRNMSRSLSNGPTTRRSRKGNLSNQHSNNNNNNSSSIHHKSKSSSSHKEKKESRVVFEDDEDDDGSTSKSSDDYENDENNNNKQDDDDSLLLEDLDLDDDHTDKEQDPEEDEDDDDDSKSDDNELFPPPTSSATATSTLELSLRVVDQAFGPKADLYRDVLGVKPNATPEQIQRGYFHRRNELFQQLAEMDSSKHSSSRTSSKLRLSPVRTRDQDNTTNNKTKRKQAERQMDAVVLAMRILGDPDLRTQYDDVRTERLKGGPLSPIRPQKIDHAVVQVENHPNRMTTIATTPNSKNHNTLQDIKAVSSSASGKRSTSTPRSSSSSKHHQHHPQIQQQQLLHNHSYTADTIRVVPNKTSATDTKALLLQQQLKQQQQQHLLQQQQQQQVHSKKSSYHRMSPVVEKKKNKINTVFPAAHSHSSSSSSNRKESRVGALDNHVKQQQQQHERAKGKNKTMGGKSNRALTNKKNQALDDDDDDDNTREGDSLEWSLSENGTLNTDDDDDDDNATCTDIDASISTGTWLTARDSTTASHMMDDSQKGFIQRISEEVMGALEDTAASVDQVINAFTLQEEDIRAVRHRIDKVKRHLTQSL